MGEAHDELFRWHPGVESTDEPVSTLVLTVTSFGDAGHAQNHLHQNFLAELSHHELGEFDIDALLDHRDSRPAIVFDEDHFSDYHRPRMVLSELTDELGQHFLLLDGPEPALRWEALSRAVEEIIDSVGVRLTVVTDSIPMPAPHTRPVQVTRWASRPELILGHTSEFGKIQMPASFPTMLGQRLGESGHDVIGLAAHVPHYLSDIDYPDAARALVEALHQVSGLALPSHALAVAAGAVRAQIASQVENSEDLTRMLSALEEQYDARTGQRALTSPSVQVPSADDIGAEVEDFLRSMDSPTDPGHPGQGGSDSPAATPDPTSSQDSISSPDADPSQAAPRRGDPSQRSGEDVEDSEEVYRPRRGEAGHDEGDSPTDGNH